MTNFRKYDDSNSYRALVTSLTESVAAALVRLTRIVQESYAPGMSVSPMALRCGIGGESHLYPTGVFSLLDLRVV